MNNTLESLLISALALGKIDHTKPAAYEVWLRHIEDEAEFLWAQGWDKPDADDLLRWAFITASDVEAGDYQGEKADRAIARKFILGLWKVRDERINKVLHLSGDWSIEFDFIDREIAKTLPDGYTQTWQVWNRSYTRVIKDGKWSRKRHG